jgi:hypothetical protein
LAILLIGGTVQLGLNGLGFHGNSPRASGRWRAAQLGGASRGFAHDADSIGERFFTGGGRPQQAPGSNRL